MGLRVKKMFCFFVVLFLLFTVFTVKYEKSQDESSRPSATPAADTIDNKVLDSVIFDAIYKKGAWGVGSGPGSYAENTVEYRAMLQKIFDDDRFKSFVDFGCGDFQIMKLMKVPLQKSYTGIDVVADVIEANERLYGGSLHPNYKFQHVTDLGTLNGASKLLRGDMVIVKDVLTHFPNKNVRYFIDNILPNFKYALLTHDISETGNTEGNHRDIAKGQYKTLDLASPPFNVKNLQVLLEYKTLANTFKRVYLYTNPNYKL